MRPIFMALVASLILHSGSCGAADPRSSVTALITFAATDFGAPAPVSGFRRVHLTWLVQQDGVTRPALCGEVGLAFPDQPVVWEQFASLETSDGHEQWLGAGAQPFCRDVDLTGPDLAANLATAYFAAADPPSPAIRLRKR